MKYMVTMYDKMLSKYISEGQRIDPAPLFIMGTGRTGSTLLSCVLNNHENICIPGECDLIPMMIKYFHRKKHLSWELKVDFVMNLLSRPTSWKFNENNIKNKLVNLENDKKSQEFIIELIYAEIAIKQNKTGAIWGEKKPANTYYCESMRRLFPNCKQLFLLRDPRDVIASYIKINQSAKFYKFFIWRWKNASKRYFNMKSTYPDDTYLQRYEDFVTEPKEHVKDILTWLNLPYHEEIFHDYHKNMSFLGETDASYHQNIVKPIMRRPSKRWETSEEKKILSEIERACKQEMKLLGY